MHCFRFTAFTFDHFQLEQPVMCIKCKGPYFLSISTYYYVITVNKYNTMFLATSIEHFFKSWKNIAVLEVSWNNYSLRTRFKKNNFLKHVTKSLQFRKIALRNSDVCTCFWKINGFDNLRYNEVNFSEWNN